MKKSIFLFFAAILCATSAWAYTISSAKIYYDDSNSQWGSDVVVAFDKSDGGAVFAMTKIANTNLYYWTGSWGDGAVSYMRFGKTTKTYNWYGWWNNVKNTWDLSTTDNWSGVSNGWGLDINNASKLFGAKSNSSGADLTKTDLTNYSSLNSTQTIKSAYKATGSTYKDANTPAQISITSYALTGNGTATQQKVSLTTSAKSASVSAARTATTTLKITTVPENCKFDGWFTGLTTGDRLSEELTYTYYPTAATTIYARFSENCYYLAGTLVGDNSWAADKQPMAKNSDGTYSYTFTNLAAGEYEFKVTDGTWGKNWNWNNVVGEYCELSQAAKDDNIKLTLSAPTTFTITFNKTENQISFDGLTDKYTYFLMGVKGDWSTGIPMVKHPNKANEYMLTCQPIVKETDAIKVVKFECGNPNVYCGTVEDNSVEHAFTNDDNKNIVLNSGVYDFYYKISENKVYIGSSSCVVEYTITAHSTTGGTIIGSGTYKHGATVTLTAIANDGYKFVNWTKAGEEVSTEATYSLTVTENVDLVANFEKILIEIGDGDNSEVLNTYKNQTVDVKVNRTFKANDGYYTICLPFDLPASKIGTAYQVAYITEHVADQGFYMVFDEVQNLEAGQPYLILPNDLTNPTFEDVTITYTDNGKSVDASGAGINFEMVGVINGGGQTEVGQYWVGDNGYFYNGDGTGTTAKLGLRVLFNIKDNAGTPVKIRARVVLGENAATSLDNITNGENTTIKVIENGQLIIIRDGEKFNAQGVRF